MGPAARFAFSSAGPTERKLECQGQLQHVGAGFAAKVRVFLQVFHYGKHKPARGLGGSKAKQGFAQGRAGAAWLEPLGQDEMFLQTQASL